MKKLDPGASPQEWFGNELRELRTAEKLSAKALGRLVQVSDDMILSIEKGKYPSCRRDLAQRLDDHFRTGGLFDRAWPMVFRNRDADKKRPDADKHSGGRGGKEPFRCGQAPSWAETTPLLVPGAMSQWIDARSSKSAASPPSRP